MARDAVPFTLHRFEWLEMQYPSQVRCWADYRCSTHHMSNIVMLRGAVPVTLQRLGQIEML